MEVQSEIAKAPKMRTARGIALELQQRWLHCRGLNVSATRRLLPHPQCEHR